MLGGEGVVIDLGDLGARDPPAGVGVVDRIGVLDGLPGIVIDLGDGILQGLVHSDGDRYVGPAGKRSLHDGAAVLRRVGAHRHPCPGHALEAGGGGQRATDQPGSNSSVT